MRWYPNRERSVYQVDDPIPAREEMRRGPRPLKIELEIPCARCGYVLAGLKTSGKCPECGSPIVAAVYGDRLEYAAPGYVRRLWIGAWIGRVGVGAMLVLFVVTGIPLLVCVFFSRGMPPAWVMAMFWVTFLVAPGLAWAAGLGAWWLMATPDPALAGGSRVRRVLRAVIVVEAACWLVSFGLGLGGALGSVPPAVYVPASAVCGIVGPFALLAHLVLASRYVRSLGARVRGTTVEELCVAHEWSVWIGGAVVGFGVAGFIMRNETLIMLAMPLVFLALCVLAWMHLALMAVVRESAKDAMEGGVKRARGE